MNLFYFKYFSIFNIMLNRSGKTPKTHSSGSKSVDKNMGKNKTSGASISSSGTIRKIDNLIDTKSIGIPLDKDQRQDSGAVALKDRNVVDNSDSSLKFQETQIVQEKSTSLMPKSESWLEQELEEKRVILKAFWDQRVINLNQESINGFKENIIKEHFPQNIEWEKQIEQLFADAISGEIKFDAFFNTLKFIPWWPILGMDNFEKLDKPTPVSKGKIEESNPEVKDDDIAKIREYMQEKGMSGSICLGSDDKKLVTSEITENEPASSYAIHSIGKVFTGILALLMVREGVILDADLKAPVQLDESVINALPPKVREQLKKVSLHELMTHKAGLGNYMGGYIGAISKGTNLEMRTPNDFLQFAEDEVFPIGEQKYSNLGILIVSLAIQHAYVKKHGACEYNEILKKYIIDEVGMPSFSLQKPENAKFNHADSIAAHFEGSPAGGYWMTTEDLAKFGQWIYDKAKDDSELEPLMKKYGQEFYDADSRAVFHTGDIPSSSALISVSLKTGELVSILSDQPYMAFELYKVVQENIIATPPTKA